MPSELIHEYLRIDHLPHIWCAGCGNGTLTRDLVVALDDLINDGTNDITRENVVIVSGIGCSSRAAGYMDFSSIHTTHGRAIAFATGIKVANPELTVIVVTGDGDCSAIGGNHLIHRRFARDHQFRFFSKGYRKGVFFLHHALPPKIL